MNNTPKITPIYFNDDKQPWAVILPDAKTFSIMAEHLKAADALYRIYNPGDFRSFCQNKAPGSDFALLYVWDIIDPNPFLMVRDTDQMARWCYQPILLPIDLETLTCNPSLLNQYADGTELSFGSL